MEQKKINDLSKKYELEYEQSKLDYKVAKVFFYNMPFWKYVISFFIILSLFCVIGSLKYISNNNMNNGESIQFLLMYGAIIPVWITIVATFPPMCLKPNKKYFDTVLNKIERKVQLKSIILKDNSSTQQIKNVINEILNTLNHNDHVICYLDIYGLYTQSRGDFRMAKKRLKNLDNKIDRIIEKQKQKDNIQEYINQYNCQ